MSNALTLLGSGDELAKMFSSQSKFLPQFKIFYPVESVPLAFKACIVDQSGATELKEPYHIGLVHGRMAARKNVADLVKDPKAVEYDRAYQGAKTNDKYLAYLLDRENPLVQTGVSACVAIFTGDDKVALAVADNFKTNDSYWRKVLGNAILKNGAIVRVDIMDHTVNLTTSKKNKKMSYLAGEKFTQWKQEIVTKEQMKLLETAMTDRKDAIDEWLKK